MAVEPINHNRNQYKRIAERLNIDFSIDDSNYLTTYRGWKSETRQATDEELEMWRLIVPQNWLDELQSEKRSLNTIEKEIDDSLEFITGPIYISQYDVAPMLKINKFVPTNCKDKLLDCEIGSFNNNSVYVSREIYKGYFYAQSKKILILHWRPSNIEREIQPLLDEVTKNELAFNMEPFIISNY